MASSKPNYLQKDPTSKYHHMEGGGGRTSTFERGDCGGDTIESTAVYILPPFSLWFGHVTLWLINEMVVTVYASSKAGP